MTAKMRSEDECFSEAAEMDRKAEACAVSPAQASYLALAEIWRWVAQQARWQDTPEWRRFCAEIGRGSASQSSLTDRDIWRPGV
jgi:hypothetical protein